MLAVRATVAAVAGPSDTLRYAVKIQGNPAGSSLGILPWNAAGGRRQ